MGLFRLGFRGFGLWSFEVGGRACRKVLGSPPPPPLILIVRTWEYTGGHYNPYEGVRERAKVVRTFGPPPTPLAALLLDDP